MSKVVSG